MREQSGIKLDLKIVSNMMLTYLFHLRIAARELGIGGAKKYWQPKFVL